MKDYDRITADDFKITHSNGDILNKAQKRADILANKITDPTAPFRMGESFVQVYAQSAVSKGILPERFSTVHFTNSYVKRNGNWQVVASQITRSFPPDPNAEETIEQLMEDLRKARLTGDKTAFNRIIADDWIVTLPDGKVVGDAKKDEMNKLVRLDSSYVLKNEEIKVHFNNPNTAVVTMLVTDKGKYGDTDINRLGRVSHFLLRRGGRWQIISTHQTDIAQTQEAQQK